MTDTKTKLAETLKLRETHKVSKGLPYDPEWLPPENILESMMEHCDKHSIPHEAIANAYSGVMQKWENPRNKVRDPIKLFEVFFNKQIGWLTK